MSIVDVLQRIYEKRQRYKRENQIMAERLDTLRELYARREHLKERYSVRVEVRNDLVIVYDIDDAMADRMRADGWVVRRSPQGYAVR